VRVAQTIIIRKPINTLLRFSYADYYTLELKICRVRKETYNPSVGYEEERKAAT